MGLLSWASGKLGLTETDRRRIYSLFGSFDSNKFALDSGSVIEHSYESNVDVYSLIRKIADVSKSIDWIVERRQPDGTWMEVKDTPIHDLMANPNREKGYTWDDIEEQILIYLLTTGNNYMVGLQAVGFQGIQELDILPPYGVTIESGQDFFMPAIKYKFQLGRTKRSYEKQQVEHIKYFNPKFADVTQSLYGLSPIQAAARVVQVSNDRWEADASLMQNRGAIGLISDRSNKPMSPEQAKVVQDSFDRDMVGARRFGKVKVTNKDLTYIPMAMSSTDLQLLEKGIVNLRSICNVFGLDSSLFNDPANKTFNNRLEAEKSLFTNAVIPLSEKIAMAHTSYIANSFYPAGDHRMRQDFSAVEALQKNIAEKAKTAIELVRAGIITANEAREILEYEADADNNSNILKPNNAPTVNIS